MSRYIDAEDLKRSYVPLEGCLDMRTLDEAKFIFDALVDLTPTADVAEVKHGRWIEEDDAIIHGHCSSCGWSAIWQETDVFGMPYCPNCGAKMLSPCVECEGGYCEDECMARAEE